MIFKVVNDFSFNANENIVYLRYIDYDDYGYCTTYEVRVKSPTGTVELGFVKIGCCSLRDKVEPSKSQNGFDSFSINKIMPTIFSKEIPLPHDFFSLGGSIQYYKSINEYFEESNIEYYGVMNDIACDFERFKDLYDSREACLINSLLRNVHYSDVEQFHRISIGDSELTNYSFNFIYNNETENNMKFVVKPYKLPPSNIHVLIGRNGVGKTWLLYQMAICVLKSMEIAVDDTSSTKYSTGTDFILENWGTRFSGVVGISFSVFDDGLSSIRLSPVDSIVDKQEKSRVQEKFEQIYKYIGIIKTSSNMEGAKNQTNSVSVKTIDDLSTEFKNILEKVTSDRNKKFLYLEVCDGLETDAMFRDNGFIAILRKHLKEPSDNNITDVIHSFRKLSSGHMIIILSLTILCESIHEKTIVFIDEPETHLHPPLLSTYIRTLSVLLRKRNAIGIIATHSPIVLQEVPSSCVTKVERVGGDMTFYRPETETFAASTDQLTREVFGYEIMKTGFYKLIEDNLQDDFDSTYEEFNNHIGFLGQIMIQGLLNRNGGDKDEED